MESCLLKSPYHWFTFFQGEDIYPTLWLFFRWTQTPSKSEEQMDVTWNHDFSKDRLVSSGACKFRWKPLCGRSVFSKQGFGTRLIMDYRIPICRTFSRHKRSWFICILQLINWLSLTFLLKVVTTVLQLRGQFSMVWVGCGVLVLFQVYINLNFKN